LAPPWRPLAKLQTQPGRTCRWPQEEGQSQPK
jgi:hypothetical protein